MTTSLPQAPAAKAQPTVAPTQADMTAVPTARRLLVKVRPMVVPTQMVTTVAPMVPPPARVRPTVAPTPMDMTAGPTELPEGQQC